MGKSGVSIPALEGPKNVCPLDIREQCLYSDSLVCLAWIKSYTKLEKLNKRTVFVQNRLEKLNKLCIQNPIKFTFVDGISNPADFVTREISYKQLNKSNYLCDPDFLSNENAAMVVADRLSVTMPSEYESAVPPLA